MKWLLAVILLVVVVGTVSATSLNFQNPGDMDSITYRNSTPLTSPSVTWIQSSTGGNNYVRAQASGFGVPDTNNYVCMILDTPSPTTYAASTLVGLGSGSRSSIILFDSSRNVLYGPAGLTYAWNPARYEVKVNGGVGYISVNGVLNTTTPALGQNPTYVGFCQKYGQSSGTLSTFWDDLVYGTSENKYILGLPESENDTYIILDDVINDASDGLAFGANGSQVNANYMTGTWARGNASLTPGAQENKSVQLINLVTQTVYATNYTGAAYSGTVSIDIKTALIDAGAPDGIYVLTIPDTGAYSNGIWKRSTGATVTFNRDIYSVGDTATIITYVAAGGYWDTATYEHRLGVMDVFGQFHGTNNSVLTQSGSFSHQWDETTDDPGVYYAVFIAENRATGKEYVIGTDWAELNSYVTFEGYVNNAETGAPVSGAYLNFTQNTESANATTIADGNYTIADHFTTGSKVFINATAAGFRQYEFNFTPLAAKNLEINISLVPDTPTVTGVAIGGVARDSQYGRPIEAATVESINGTAVLSDATSMTGYYLHDSVNDLSYYGVHGSKTGYSNSSTYNATVNGSVSNFTQTDVWMEGQYTTTFNIIDSIGAPIPVVVITSSSGQTYTTTNGTGYLTYPPGVYVAYFATTGYNGKSLSFVVDDDGEYTVQLAKSTSSTGVDLRGTPKDVKFHIQSFFGAPITDAIVSTQGISTTTGNWDWLAVLLSISLGETPINSTEMTGTTDSNGDIVFLMLDSIKYNVTVSKSGYTFPNMIIAPQASQYTISANMNESWFSGGNDTLKDVNVSVSWANYNGTHSFVNITYDDQTTTTTGGTITVYQDATGRMANATPVSSMDITSSSCSNSTLIQVPTGGASYGVVVNATTTSGENVVRTFTHSFKGSPVLLPGFTPETLLWLSLFILIFTAGFAGALHAPQMAIILCVESWVFWSIGWLDYLINGNGYAEGAIVVILSLATFISVIWSITEGKAKGKRSS